MNPAFDTLIQSFIENKIGITENFLPSELTASLIKNLLLRVTQHEMKQAGTGNEAVILQDKLFRSDSIYWLDRKHNDLTENAFFDVMDTFITYLNETCYTGITSYEFHYTLYEVGSFYKKHLDQFKNNDSRKYSMILYLNEDWKLEDGGELCIHQANKTYNISPQCGKSVFFQSNELEHEVLVTHKARISVTGWLKVD
jgi:SM-20-related protein